MNIFKLFKKKKKVKNIIRPQRRERFESKDELKAIYEEIGLGWFFEALELKARTAIKLNFSELDEAKIGIGQSKFGGLPDLPASEMWPITKNNKPMFFIAQINLAEVSAFNTEKELPEKGVLYFFSDFNDSDYSWGSNKTDRQFHKVILFEGDLTQLKRTQMPKREEDDPDYHDRISTAEIKFLSTVELPMPFSYHYDQAISNNHEIDEETFEVYEDSILGMAGEFEVKNGKNIYNADHKLLGHSNNVQNSMEDECQAIFSGMKLKEVENGIEDWVLLLQIDSDDEIGTEWGDMGKIYYWIRKQDLEKKDFSNVQVYFQCG